MKNANVKKSYKSPLRYPGGKTRACKILDIILSKNIDLSKKTCIASPFFGGGSFEFYLQKKYNLKIKANDLFTPLANFWNICKHNKEELCNSLYSEQNITKEQFQQYRNEIMNEINSVLKAKKYFIINRCSFSGATLSGGFSPEASKKRYTKSSIDRIKQLDLSNFEISNKKFEDFLKENNSELLFVDPPYFLEKGSKLYGKNGDLHILFDHQKLFNILSKCENWLLTYNNCQYIRELYKDYKIIEVNWSYGMRKNKKNEKAKELVIINSG